MLLKLSHLRLNPSQHLAPLRRSPKTRTCSTPLRSSGQHGYRRHNSHQAAELQLAKEALDHKEAALKQQELEAQSQASITQPDVTVMDDMDTELPANAVESVSHSIKTLIRRTPNRGKAGQRLHYLPRINAAALALKKARRLLHDGHVMIKHVKHELGRPRKVTTREQAILKAEAMQRGKKVGVHGISIVKQDGRWLVEDRGKASTKRAALASPSSSGQKTKVPRGASSKESADMVAPLQSPSASLNVVSSEPARQVGHLFSIPSQAELDSKASWKWKNPDAKAPTDSISATEPILTGQATRPILITFDAFDTLFTPKEPIARQYCTISRKYGLELDENAVMASFKPAFKDMSSRYPNYGKGKQGMTPENWWTTLITNTLTPLLPETMPHLPYALPDDLYNHFSTSAAYTLFPDVMPFLSLIGTSSYSASHWAPRRTMLGVVSNSDPRVRDILSSFHPPIPFTPAMFPPRYTPHSRHTHHTFGPAHFSFAALSYETRFEKPDPRAFDRALRLAQRSLDALHPVARLTRTGNEMLRDVRSEFHCLHVGDDVDKDVLAALGAGWDVVLIDRENPAPISTRTVTLAPPPAEGEIYTGQYKGAAALAKKSKSLIEVEVTVVNSLMELQKVVTKGRLEGDASRWNQVGKRVWVDPKSLPVGAAKKVLKKDLKGRRVVDRGAGDGTSLLV